MRALNELAINAGDLSAATAASSAIDARQLLMVSVQAVVTGTASGTLIIQYSNDPGSTQSGTIPTNWSAVPSATVSVTNSGVYAIAKTELCYQWIRLLYTKTSSTGSPTINAYIKASGY